MNFCAQDVSVFICLECLHSRTPITRPTTNMSINLTRKPIQSFHRTSLVYYVVSTIHQQAFTIYRMCCGGKNDINIPHVSKNKNIFFYVYDTIRYLFHSAPAQTTLLVYNIDCLILPLVLLLLYQPNRF